MTGGSMPRTFCVSTPTSTRSRVYPRADRLPYVIEPIAFERRYRQHRRIVILLQRAERFGLLRSVELVDLRRDDGDLRLRGEQPRITGGVLRQIRMARIDQEQHACNAPLVARRGIEVCLREVFERLDRLPATSSVSIPGQIHEVQARVQMVVIRKTRFPWSGAGAGDLLFDERVDERRFTDIRAADHCYLGQAGTGKVGRRRG